MNRRVGGLFLAVGLVLGACSTDAGVRSTGADSAAMADAELTPDPATRMFTLDNGLAVYVRENNRPGGSAELRLVVNAGSSLEEPDQSGVAHFLEHMLFNGTEAYPHNELIEVLRGFGMEFGADVNAYTSYDETVYELTVPVDDSGNLGSGLDVLAEWLSKAAIGEDEVIAERGVVLDEWRTRDQTLYGRQGQVLEEMFLSGSGYEGRDPIGTDAAIEAMTVEPLRRFYDTWYRPDNAAVVVVGDIDVDEVEQLVRERFEGITARAGDDTRPDLAFDPFVEAVARVAPDPDATEAMAELTWPHPGEPATTATEIRSRLLVQLGFDMIATRLDDDISGGDAAFTDAVVSSNNSVRMIDAPSVYVSAEAADGTAAIDALVVEFERARRYGFDENEVARAIDYYRSAIDADHESRDTRSDSGFAGSFVDHFLTGSPIPSADDEYAVYTEMLDAITTEQISAAFENFLDTSAPHLFVSVPDDSSDIPTEGELLALLAAAADREIEPREPTAAAIDSLMKPPAPVQETDVEEFVSEFGAFLDATAIEFPNGATVILNPTEIADNDVSLLAWSDGGTSLMDPADALAARYSAWVAPGSGLGDLDANQVRRLLEATTVDLQTYIGVSEEAIYGSTGTDDLEIALQVQYLWFTAPQFDQTVLDSVIDSDQQYLDDPAADPDMAAYVAATEARYGDDLRYAAVPTQAQLDAITIADLERAFADRISSPEDWVFVVSGDFDVDEATELMRRYVGSLPRGDGSEAAAEVTPAVPSGVVARDVQAGTGDQGSLSVTYEVASDGSPFEIVRADVLTNVLNTRLVDHVREKLGASYSPNAYVEIDQFIHSVRTTVSVSGDPAGLDELRQIVLDDMVDIATNGPTAAEFDAAIAALEQDYQLFDNAMVAYSLMLMHNDRDYLDVYLGKYSELLALSRSNLATFAKRVLPLDQRIEIVQRPR